MIQVIQDGSRASVQAAAIFSFLHDGIAKRSGQALQNRGAQQEALNTENASALTTEANNGLELVDALEQLF